MFPGINGTHLSVFDHKHASDTAAVLYSCLMYRGNFPPAITHEDEFRGEFFAFPLTSKGYEAFRLEGLSACGWIARLSGGSILAAGSNIFTFIT
jgi:hypothetical protein